MSDFDFKDTTIYPNVEKVEDKSSELVVEETVLEPVVEEKPVDVIDTTPVVEVKEEVKEEIKPAPVSGNKIAVYALRTLTLPGGTIPKGYSYINKAQYEKVANHKALRLASKEEIKDYLS